MPYTVIYSDTSRQQIRSLHPEVKAIVKACIKDLREDPAVGKPLERELCGFRSYRAKRYRIIYKIDNREDVVQIYYVGHRRDLYELFAELIAQKNTESPAEAPAKQALPLRP